MAMTMTGEVQLSAAATTVWAKLNDPEVLKACIPGCEQLDMIGDNEFQAVATNKIGPVKARFKGKVQAHDLDPPNSYRFPGEGEGGVAGFAKGGAMVSWPKGRRDAARLQRRGPDRRQARPARPAPDQRRRQEDRRPVLRQFKVAAAAVTPAAAGAWVQDGLTLPAPGFRVVLVPNAKSGAKSARIRPDPPLGFGRRPQIEAFSRILGGKPCPPSQ